MSMNMIRPVSDLRNNFADISKTVHETAQPVFLTKNGYGDMVVMSMEAFEKREEILKLRAKVMIAENERLAGQKGISIEEIKNRLEVKFNEEVQN